MIKFVQAGPEDVESLRVLAHDSEAHWGYGQQFMETFDSKFNVTEQFIANNPTYVLREDSALVAFWGLRRDFEAWELEYFYVAKQKFGKGYGKRMWNNMIGWCKAHKIRKIHFVTSPQAVGFYEKMGAIQDGVSQSMIDGRDIPRFIYDLD